MGNFQHRSLVPGDWQRKSGVPHVMSNLVIAAHADVGMPEDSEWTRPSFELVCLNLANFFVKNEHNGMVLTKFNLSLLRSYVLISFHASIMVVTGRGNA